MTALHIDASSGATYSPAVAAAGLVFTSGQVGIEPRTGTVPDAFDDEVGVAFDNLDRVLVAAGASMASLVRVTCYLADVELAGVFNQVYLDRVPEPRPDRATVQVRMIPPYRIELECIASLD